MVLLQTPPAKPHEDRNDLVQTAASLKEIKNIDLTLLVDSDVIKSISVVRDLGVLLGQELSLKQHICKVTRIYLFLPATYTRSRHHAPLGFR